MPIILPEGLASAALLRREGIEVLHRPPRQGSVLRVGFLNLMPDMTGTEIQFARLLGATRRHVELVLALPPSYRCGHEGTGLYARWGETSLPRRLDGLIVTGAPLEHIPFEDVTYWRELVRICDWAASNVGSTLYICWAAFAALYTFHGVRTRVLPHKISGVFQQQVTETTDPLTAGLGARPHHRRGGAEEHGVQPAPRIGAGRDAEVSGPKATGLASVPRGQMVQDRYLQGASRPPGWLK